MAKSCRVTPMVKNPMGEEVPSKLYDGLNGIMTIAGNGGRRKVLPLYQQTLDPQFTKDMTDRGVQLDENGEVTLYGFLNNTDVGKSIDDSTRLTYLNSPNNFFTKDELVGKEGIETRDRVLDSAVKLNDSEWGTTYEAKLVKTDNKYKVVVSKKTEESNLSQRQLKYFSRLSKKLAGILNEWGVAAVDVEDLESRITGGYVNFEDTTKLADGLIALIKIAKGKKGDKALPEEFSHLVIRSLKNSPLVTRVINDLKKDDKYKTVLGSDLEKYTSLYHNDVDKLAEEAAGKLLMERLRKADLNLEHPTNLIDRIVLAFQRLFSKFDELRIKNAVVEADKELDILANDILTGKYTHLDLNNLGKGTMYNLLDEIKKSKTIWDKLYEITLRRQHIYKMRSNDLNLSGSDPTTVDKQFVIEEQEGLLGIQDRAAHETDWSQYTTTEQEWKKGTLWNTMVLAIEDCTRLQDMLNTLQNSPIVSSYNNTCAKLRMIKDYLDSYKILCDHYQDLFVNGFDDPELDNDPSVQAMLNQLKGYVASLSENLNEMEIQYKKVAQPIFIKAISQVCPEGAILRLNGNIVDIKELVVTADDDIGFMSRWLNSMANTSDDLAKIYDQIVKQKKGLARQETLDIRRNIIAAGKKLHYKGAARIQEFMYEHNPDGSLVLDKNGMPSYIKKYNNKQYEDTVNKLYEDLELKYASDPDADTKIKQEVDTWMAENMEEVNGTYYPRPDKFPSSAYQNLAPEEKEFYDLFMQYKQQLDKYLPRKVTQLHRPILVRKEGLERILTVNNGHEFWTTLKDYFSDMFKRKETDDEYGETKTTVKDFQGNELKQLPIYYVRKGTNTNINNYSMDCVSNMIIYAQMATNYKAMSQIVNTLEVGTYLLNFRERLNKEGKKALVEKIRHNGFELVNFLKKTDGKSNLRDRIEDFMDMQVYGQMKDDKTILGGLSSSKVGDLWATIVALNTTAINLASGIVNILQGLHQINLEMFAHEYYGAGDLLAAKWYYWRYVWEAILQAGNPAKTSKLALFSEDFNVMQDYEASNREVDFYKRNRFYKMMSTSSLFALNNIGEHYLQHLTALALAHHDYIIDGNGNHISVFDAYEKKWIDPHKHSLGATLTLKKYQGPSGESQTYKTQDGRIIVTREQLEARQEALKQQGKDVDLYSKALLWNANEISEFEFKNEFSRKSGKINQDLHGIYNQEDKNALQKYALGRLAIMYRKHITPNTMKRWKGEGYDFDLKQDTKGFQRTAANFWGKFFKELVVGDEDGKHHLGLYQYQQLSEHEKANMRRNLANFLDFWSTEALILILDSGGDDDDDDWMTQILLTVLYRQRAEIAFFTPSSVFTGYNLVTDWLRVFKEPVIGMSWIEKYANLPGLLYPGNWTTEIEGGKYDGYTKAEKIILQTIPFKKQIDNIMDPDYSQFI